MIHQLVGKQQTSLHSWSKSFVWTIVNKMKLDSGARLLHSSCLVIPLWPAKSGYSCRISCLASHKQHLHPTSTMEGASPCQQCMGPRAEWADHAGLHLVWASCWGIWLCFTTGQHAHTCAEGFKSLSWPNQHDGTWCLVGGSRHWQTVWRGHSKHGKELRSARLVQIWKLGIHHQAQKLAGSLQEQQVHTGCLPRVLGCRHYVLPQRASTCHYLWTEVRITACLRRDAVGYAYTTLLQRIAKLTFCNQCLSVEMSQSLDVSSLGICGRQHASTKMQVVYFGSFIHLVKKLRFSVHLAR